MLYLLTVSVLSRPSPVLPAPSPRHALARFCSLHRSSIRAPSFFRSTTSFVADACDVMIKAHSSGTLDIFRSYPNTPGPSYPSTSAAQYNYQQGYHHQSSAYGGGDGYGGGGGGGGPSSLPSQSYLMQQPRSQSLGPAADDPIYSTSGGGGYGATRLGDSPMNARRSQSFGLTRPALTRYYSLSIAVTTEERIERSSRVIPQSLRL